MDRPRANDAREEQQTREDTQGDSAAGKLLQADPDSEGRVAARDCRKGYTGGLPVGMGFSLGEVDCSRTRSVGVSQRCECTKYHLIVYCEMIKELTVTLCVFYHLEAGHPAWGFIR